jgi:hypothetical protein
MTVSKLGDSFTDVLYVMHASAYELAHIFDRARSCIDTNSINVKVVQPIEISFDSLVEISSISTIT